MQETFVEAHTLPGAYHSTLLQLYHGGDKLSCNDWGCDQIESSATFVVTEPFAEPMISKLFIGGHQELQQYVMEITDGLLDFRVGNGFEYTYHDRLVRYDGKFNQLQFIIDELNRTPDSRRAVALIRDNKVDPFTDSAACLQHAQFFIRERKLHMKVLMRSNDAVKAAFMNAFAFIMLQKKIADELGIEVGTYTHRANSFHVYSKDFEMFERYVDAIKTKLTGELTYKYEGVYKEMMEESIPEIQKSIEKLRGNQ